MLCAGGFRGLCGEKGLVRLRGLCVIGASMLAAGEAWFGS